MYPQQPPSDSSELTYPPCRQFVNELVRVCAPGGNVLIVTWCHRVLAPGEGALTPDEQALLDRICEAYYLPAWCSVADYEQILSEWLLFVTVRWCGHWRSSSPIVGRSLYSAAVADEGRIVGRSLVSS